MGAPAAYEMGENLLVCVSYQYEDVHTEENVAVGTVAGNSDNSKTTMRALRSF